MTLLPTNDNVDEPDGSVTVELLPGAGYTLGTATSATVTILDDDEPPGAPTLTVTPGNAQAALAWTAPSDTGSETITGYEYQREQRWGHDVGSGLDRDREQRTRRD